MTKPGKRPRSKRSHPEPLQTEAQATEAAFATLGRELVRFLRDNESAATDETAAAWKLAEWLYEHRLTDIERHYFMTRTGWAFEYELSALPTDEPLRRASDIEPNPTNIRRDDEIPF